MSNRKFIASSDLFSNFEVDICLYNINTIEDIIKEFKSRLREVLEKNNFTNLIKILDNRSFHIHSYTIEEILVSGKDSIFYVCDHT